MLVASIKSQINLLYNCGIIKKLWLRFDIKVIAGMQGRSQEFEEGGTKKFFVWKNLRGGGDFSDI